MARVCQVTGKGPMSGNNVSHANNRTKRRFLPNLQYRRFWVESENHWVRLRVSSAGLRTIDKNGIDVVLADLRARGELPREVVSATRGNHGQSIAWAARAHGVRCRIVVPRGNSVEKNAAMRALGAELIEHGDDFTASADPRVRQFVDGSANGPIKMKIRDFDD